MIFLRRRAMVTALVLGLVMNVLPGAMAETRKKGASSQDVRVGVLMVDHGEPPEYNRHTYESFREFFQHLIEMGIIPAWVLYIDTGTIVQDAKCYACASSSPEFIDAWLDQQAGPAIQVPASDSTPAHHVVPGGPGLGEPDFFEHIGLAAWNEWQIMGGRSPNYDQKVVKKEAVIDRLRQRYGADVPVRIGYGIDPRLGGRRYDIAKAVTQLIEEDEVDRIVAAYHGVGYSDIMQTHHVRHQIEELVAELDPSVEVTYAEPIGTTDAYVQATVEKVRSELSRLPRGADVAIHLSGHGLSTTMCGEYDCGSDAYHRSSRSLFRRTSRAIAKSVRWDGRFGVFHIYGDGGEGDSDPDDVVDSPMEALAKRKDAGFTHVVDIPYEFDSDSRDTLIVLRRSYQLEIPDWNERYESFFRYEGIQVKITGSSYGEQLKTDAYEEVILDALRTESKHPHHEH